MPDTAPRLPISLLFKSIVLRTALGTPAARLRWPLGAAQRFRHPELWELYLEERRLPVVLSKLLAHDSCAVDVGAHVGSFLKLLLKYAPEGQHSAFEASPTKARWLQTGFPKVKVFPVAVSSTSGVAVFHEDYARPGFSSLSGDNHSTSSVSYEVQTQTLDEALGDVNRLDLIKLDIEGAELDALHGAVGLIERFRPGIIFECGTEYQSSRSDLFDFLTKKLGYNIFNFTDFLFDKGEMSFDEFRKCGIYPFRGFNFIARPRSGR